MRHLSGLPHVLVTVFKLHVHLQIPFPPSQHATAQAQSLPDPTLVSALSRLRGYCVTLAQDISFTIVRRGSPAVFDVKERL